MMHVLAKHILPQATLNANVYLKNVPTSVDDFPVTSDTPWRVAH
jgi:hypothetical protein